MQKQDILKKYPNQEDRLIISKLLDKIKERDRKNKICSTDFLGIHERAVCEEVLKNEKVQNYIFAGGRDDAERVILIFYPEKLEGLQTNDVINTFISIVRITLPKYISGYLHRDYLGGIMKLGIKRGKIGDIIVLEDGADIVVCADIDDFLSQELNKLTRFSKAKIEKKDICEIRNANIEKEEHTIIVPSYRIDAIASEAIHMSRSKVSEIIDEERVFINGLICKNGAKLAKIGDKITVRGKGRFEVVEEIGSTRKENIRLKILKYV